MAKPSSGSSGDPGSPAKPAQVASTTGAHESKPAASGIERVEDYMEYWTEAHKNSDHHVGRLYLVLP